MAVMLDINYSKKLGLPNYSSHSLGIGLKAEVANLDEVQGEVEKAYSLLQSAVDSQIVHSGFVSNESNEVNGSVQGQKIQPQASMIRSTFACRSVPTDIWEPATRRFRSVMSEQS